MQRPLDRTAVIGSGTLGAQIAMLAANAGYQVKAFDVREGALDQTLNTVKGIEILVPKSNWPTCRKRIQVTTDLTEAVADAELVIEVVPEILDLKRKVWSEIGSKAHPNAIMATNSSSIPVSRLEKYGNRLDKSLNIHFYIGMPMADVMAGTKTSDEVFEIGTRWVRSLKLIPLTVKKEILGFCFNRVWRAVKREVLRMWAEGYVDFRDVDRAWMLFNGMKHDSSAFGPFALMDKVGLDVIYDIEMVYFNESQDPKDFPPAALKEKIEKGELGVKSGKGFYSYPDPEYLNPDFLNPLT